MILKNGKRLDGCTDTLPVGTVQPFLGLTPPLGYLVCQGQLISKVEYPELYKLCGSTFGTETSTHFYLPDLRGKTIAGYDSNDSTMNTIGKLLGQKTHTHTSAAHTHSVAGHTHTSAAHSHSSAAHSHSTGNHTLTIAEIPAHQHMVQTFPYQGSDGSYYCISPTPGYQVDPGTHWRGGFADYTGGSGAHNHGNTGSTTPGNTGSTTPGATGSTSLTTNSTTPNATGSNTNFQPTVIMNWIVKAAMLIPEYFIVENTLTSTSTSNALSAAQGKILNDKIDKFLPYPGSRLAWNWGTTIPDNGYTQLIEWMTRDGGGSMGFAEKNGQLSVQVDGLFYQDEGLYRVLDTRDLAASYAFYKWPSKISISTSGTTSVSKELTITTKKGNPVFLIVTGDNNPMTSGAKNWFNINFYRNGTLLCHQIVESHEVSHNIPFAMQYLDAVETGTYTYKVEFTIGAGSADLGENGWQQTPNFTVFEI